MTARWAGGCAPPTPELRHRLLGFQGDVSRRPFCVEITRKSVCVSDPDVQSCAQAWDGPGDCFSAWALPPSPSLWGSPLSPDALASGGGWPCGPSPHPRAAPPDLCPPPAAFPMLSCPHPGPSSPLVALWPLLQSCSWSLFLCLLVAP